jgi:hypothetical protein
MNIDPGRRAEAIERFVTLARCSDADAELLVDAALQAGVDQVLETIVGSGPPPTNMTYLKAEHLHYVCMLAQRTLTQQEVGVLFRLPAAPARSILTTMRATYADPLRDIFMARMRADARITSSGTEADGLTYTLTFSEENTTDTATAELERLGIPVTIPTGTKFTIVVSRVSDGGEDTLARMGIRAASRRPRS